MYMTLCGFANLPIEVASCLNKKLLKKYLYCNFLPSIPQDTHNTHLCVGKWCSSVSKHQSIFLHKTQHCKLYFVFYICRTTLCFWASYLDECINSNTLVFFSYNKLQTKCTFPLSSTLSHHHKTIKQATYSI